MTVEQAFNRLAKWRTVLAGWQLGTRSKEDPEAQAVRDQREAQLVMRAELSAISALLLKNKVCTRAQFEAQLVEEAAVLETMLERRFPGAKATDAGMELRAPASEWLSKFPQ